MFEEVKLETASINLVSSGDLVTLTNFMDLWSACIYGGKLVGIHCRPVRSIFYQMICAPTFLVQFVEATNVRSEEDKYLIGIELLALISSKDNTRRKVLLDNGLCCVDLAAQLKNKFYMNYFYKIKFLINSKNNPFEKVNFII